jgi:hypothetical protein
MAINRSSIAKELLPGLNAVFGMEYGEVDNEHEPLYEVEQSDRAFEEEVLFTGFGTAPVKGEGAAVQYDDAQEGYTARYTHETVALAFAVTLLGTHTRQLPLLSQSLKKLWKTTFMTPLPNFVRVVLPVQWQTPSR